MVIIELVQFRNNFTAVPYFLQDKKVTRYSFNCRRQELSVIHFCLICSDAENCVDWQIDMLQITAPMLSP
jgi:hypothetical protein